MKKITKYECEICHKQYDIKDKAIQCEKQGSVKLSDFKIGTMFSYEHNGYVGIFAIAKVHPSEYNKHFAEVSNWACRVSGNDSLNDETCGGGSDSFVTIEKWIKYHNMEDKYVNNDDFNRMVKYLKGKRITPRYYQNGKLFVL